MQTSEPAAVQQYPFLVTGGLSQMLSGLPVRSMEKEGVNGSHCENAGDAARSASAEMRVNIFVFIIEIFIPILPARGTGIFSVVKVEARAKAIM